MYLGMLFYYVVIPIKLAMDRSIMARMHSWKMIWLLPLALICEDDGMHCRPK